MIEFTASDIQKLLSNLNCNKSPGPDNIHPRVLKECAGVLAEPLCFLFTTSLHQGQLPGMWKDAKVTPIFKRGSRADVGNYRPISLTSICCKTMEKLVRDSVLQHMVVNNFLSDNQHGFVHGRSCTTQLLKVIDKITEMMDAGIDLDIIFLDFSKGIRLSSTSEITIKARELRCVWTHAGMDTKFPIIEMPTSRGRGCGLIQVLG